jgi:hypothetical protein
MPARAHSSLLVRLVSPGRSSFDRRSCKNRPFVALSIAFVIAFALAAPVGAKSALAQDVLAQEKPVAPVPARAASAKKTPPPIYPRDDFQDNDVVYRVRGDQVNLRSGPSVDYAIMGQLARGTYVVQAEEPTPEGADLTPKTEKSGAPKPPSEWQRIKVPGGTVVYVFADLVEQHANGLTGRVRGDDVLMRSAQARARLPLADQRLGRGDELLVVGEIKDEDGVWLKDVPPAHTFVWMHAKFLEKAGTVGALRREINLAAELRVDGLSGGKTARLRETWLSERRTAFRKRLVRWRAVLASSAATEKHIQDCRGAIPSAPDDATRKEASFLLTSMQRSLADRKAREKRAQATADAAALKAARQRAKEEREKFDREREETGKPKPPARGVPDAEGVVEMNGDQAVLVYGAGLRVRLRSQKFRMKDYAGKRIRVWGTRLSGTKLKQLRVDKVEVVPD